MNANTMAAVAVHYTETREEVLEVAQLLCAFASVAHAAGHWSLRDRLIERAAVCLEDE